MSEKMKYLKYLAQLKTNTSQFKYDLGIIGECNFYCIYSEEENTM
jgi:hypothetical protein